MTPVAFATDADDDDHDVDSDDDEQGDADGAGAAPPPPPRGGDDDRQGVDGQGTVYDDVPTRCVVRGCICGYVCARERRERCAMMTRGCDDDGGGGRDGTPTTDGAVVWLIDG